MELIDVHGHLTSEAYENDLETVIANCDEALLAYISAGCDLSSSKDVVELASKHGKAYAVVGVHPENIENWNENSFENLKKLAKNEKVVGIGEIGLDYHYLQELSPNEVEENKRKQKMIFEKQIELANQLNLPIVVHSRDAMGDTIEILKNNPPKRNSLLHCYSGSLESAKILMSMGFSFSFGGVTTFKNAKNVQEVVKNLPLERVLLETDCPYLSPEPFRGKRNEPKNVVYVADAIARLKNITIDEVAKVTTNNAKSLFDFKF